MATAPASEPTTILSLVDMGVSPSTAQSRRGFVNATTDEDVRYASLSGLMCGGVTSEPPFGRTIHPEVRADARLERRRACVVESGHEHHSAQGASCCDLVVVVAMSATGSLSTAVGRRLQQLRLRAGIPLSRLAKHAGLSAHELRRIEEGVVQASLGTLSDLAGELGASITELVRAARQPLGMPQPHALREARTRLVPRRDHQPMGPEEIARAIVELPDGIDKIEVVVAAAVRYAVEVAGGNKSQASRTLGMQRKALERRLRQ
jgi:transcriptional regulator with XRE-family HTH domain